MKNIADNGPRGRVQQLMVSASARINYEWALRRPGRPPFLMLTEFPRSGGNWVRDMLGDALQLPVPRFSRFPITFNAIVHNHDHRPTDHPTVYVVRDPRDVFISHYHKIISTWIDAPPQLRRRIARFHPALASVSSAEEVNENVMTAFYSEWSTRSLGARASWKNHVGAFLRVERPNITVIRYEDMRNDPVGNLTRAIQNIIGTAPRNDVITFAVARNEFSRQAGRESGVADNRATKRQGVVGGWRKDLPPALIEKMSCDLAAELTLAGYAK